MKIYLSVDIEGITGVTHWDETDRSKPDNVAFVAQMNAEAAAACEGALQADASEIVVKDAHWTARNLDGNKLPVQAKLVRGWSNHPLSMIEDLDESFAALLMVGYHAAGGLGTNPLAHTMSDTKIDSVHINQNLASELMIHAYAAALFKVPLVFVSGDNGVCEQAAALIPSITTVAVKQGIGDSTINLHPSESIERIRAGVRESLLGDLSCCLLALPKHFRVEVRYKEHPKAYQYSFYPGASLVDPHTLLFESDDYFEVLRYFVFVL